MEMKQNLLTLYYLGISNKSISFIYYNFDQEDMYDLLQSNMLHLQFKYNIFSTSEIDSLSDLNKRKLAEQKASETLLLSDREGIQIISIFDEAYPESLKEIHNPPLFLNAIGNVSLLKTKDSVACVGTRKPSSQSKLAVKKLVSGLSKADQVIVSGLAFGIDYESHKVCLENDGLTIAVLAHGLDKIYPSEHHKFSQEILNKDGLLLSEYPIRTPIKKEYFVQRNRIIAGLSQGVIVFEADERSGTMHTARFAYKQHKQIFCPADNTSSGVLKLIESNSALSVSSAKEILDVLSQHSLTAQQEDKLSFQIDFSLSNEALKESLFKKVTTRIDSNVYKKVKDIAKENDITTKEMINALMRSFVISYEGRNQKNE
ncbi:DNA-protecting protein DprA [Paenibacillus taichungensis]|uniref:DNA-protecting protein DprA n=1 Tax=Paenibacillus taichungensis TaxID=484184 RepID=A0ABX2MSK3_9BACL|nr:DNA-processing protein DprA [Paenibacillus taichungensis]NUU57072.1 DNA-protecting protein DprA [Paenibacillus taichungensis]